MTRHERDRWEGIAIGVIAAAVCFAGVVILLFVAA
jgi:hypothetical protein